MTPQDLLTPELKKELVEFARSLVRTKSFSGHEEGVIRLIEKKMKELGFDEVTIDSMGNVLGRMGHEGKSTLFDSARRHGGCNRRKRMGCPAVQRRDQGRVPVWARLGGHEVVRGRIDLCRGDREIPGSWLRTKRSTFPVRSSRRTVTVRTCGTCSESSISGQTTR